MIAISSILILRERPVTATTWHLCTVIIPRRTITGRLVRGQVWRRHDGRHWLTKNLSFRGRRRERMAAASDSGTERSERGCLSELQIPRSSTSKARSVPRGIGRVL
jgi:hypothetical protein